MEIPSTPGSIRSSTMRSNGARGHALERLAAVADGGGLQPLEAQVKHEEVADVGVVFDNEHVWHEGIDGHGRCDI